MSRELSLELPRSRAAPGRARAAVRRLARHIDPRVLPDVQLVVSELIANSVKYGADGPVRLDVTAEPNRIRAEIKNEGSRFVPKARTKRLDEPGGWGLHLVDRLTSRWGVRRGRAHVWFEIDSPAGAH